MGRPFIRLCYTWDEVFLNLIGQDVIDDFKKKHSNSRTSLDRWVKLIKGCNAKHSVDLKRTFGSVDPVPPQTVFDIGGNNFRVITEIDYDIQIVVVTYVLTHEEYDKNKWKIL